jgi:hypothetical protein
MALDDQVIADHGTETLRRADRHEPSLRMCTRSTSPLRPDEADADCVLALGSSRILPRVERLTGRARTSPGTLQVIALEPYAVVATDVPGCLRFHGMAVTQCRGEGGITVSSMYIVTRSWCRVELAQEIGDCCRKRGVAAYGLSSGQISPGRQAARAGRSPGRSQLVLVRPCSTYMRSSQAPSACRPLLCGEILLLC